MYEFVQYTTADAMTRNPVTVGPQATLADAQALFEEHGFNGMPVVEDEGRLAGFVTKMDILRAFTMRPEYMVPPYSEIMQKMVSEVMSREPVTVTPDYPLTRVLQRLVEMGVKSLPVLSAERVVGIVARENVLETLKKATA